MAGEPVRKKDHDSDLSRLGRLEAQGTDPDPAPLAIHFQAHSGQEAKGEEEADHAEDVPDVPLPEPVVDHRRDAEGTDPHKERKSLLLRLAVPVDLAGAITENRRAENAGAHEHDEPDDHEE